MTNPKAVVPHIEELIHQGPREKAGQIHLEDAKRLQIVRTELYRYFDRIERELVDLRGKIKGASPQ